MGERLYKDEHLFAILLLTLITRLIFNIAMSSSYLLPGARTMKWIFLRQSKRNG